MPSIGPAVLKISNAIPGCISRCPSGSDDLESLVPDLDGLDRHCARVALQAGPGVLARPATHEAPAHHLVALLVAQHHGAFTAIDSALRPLAEPVEDVELADDAALEHDV